MSSGRTRSSPLFPPPRRYSMASMASAPTAKPPPDQYDPLGQGQTRRPGFLGRLGGWLASRDWEGIGAAMRDDPAILASLRDTRLQRDLFGHRVRQDKQEEAETAAERAAREAAIALLPADQQVWARLNPEAFAEVWARRQASGGWETGQGYSHAFRTNPDGTVTLGDPLPLRPRAPIQGYVMPGDMNEWDYSDE